ncbi:MAG: polysaccharide pyruvyl transferase family protein [Paludibacteraceae bacterium]|nr:polysaccharide pyruvyl transferase family protein [Paludibacteraceae bacterium]
MWDKPLTKEMVSFSLFSLWGNLAVVLSEQGINILLNIFFTSAINAAHAIAYQVQTAIIGFSSNFQMAINPQITKKYSRNDISDMHKLMFASSRFSFYLLFIITLPILIETPLILNIWLVEVPPHTVNFLRLIILTSLLNCMANPMMIAAQANGNIRTYQIVVGGILLATIPISFVLLKIFHIPELVLLVNFAVVAVAFIVRLVFMRHMVDLSITDFLKNVISKVIIVGSVSSLLPVTAYILLPHSILSACLVCFICIVSVFASVYRFGLTDSEKRVVSSKINPIREIRNQIVNDLFIFPSFFKSHLIINAWTYFRRGKMIHNNWGDDINVYLIEYLSGGKVIIRNNSLILRLLPVKNYTCIGSIIGIYENNNSIIWGTGFIDDNHYLKSVPSEIRSVRGELTRNKLLLQGIECPPIYGDPALLVSRIYNPDIAKRFDIGIIPNHINIDNPIVREYADSHDNVLLIDMTDYSKWTDIIDEIMSCRLILSDSLHGLIVADSYNIPNIWIYLSDKIVGKHFKFLDYFSSVGRTETEPIVINDSKILNHFVETINDYSCHAHIDYSKLIESCPFRIHPTLKYKYGEKTLSPIDH